MIYSRRTTSGRGFVISPAKERKGKKRGRNGTNGKTFVREMRWNKEKKEGI
jgi:hypothetical protein